MKKPKEISIVGAGLVGSLLSIYLARRGYQVLVFERRHDMRTTFLGGGRSINLALSNRGIRALEEVGLAAEMKKHAVSMKGRLMHDINGKLTYQPYGKDGQYINSISRSGLNMFLMDEAEKRGVKFSFENRCIDVNLDKTELHLVQDHGTRHHATDFIIGADGAFSAVRASMQMTDRFEYQQHFIEHGYKELRIPPGKNGEFVMEKEALHIWPRESFMLIALPNPDATFTVTLFSPFEGQNSFKEVQTDAQVAAFFNGTFPDAANLMPSLVDDFRDNPTASLVTIQCSPWVKNRTMLIGDAAHGIVPFFGQGMNAGFEDCTVFNQLLDKYNDDWKGATADFQRLRKADADAIAELALGNFIEMRDLVADPEFLLRKKIEARLYELYPQDWIPLYSMVTFHEEIRYSQALEVGRRQGAVMNRVMARPGIDRNWESLDFGAIVSELRQQQ